VRAGRSSLCTVVGCRFSDCTIIDGTRNNLMPVAAYYADQVETVEVYPPGSDWSGSLAPRGCSGGRGRILVIWMRKDTVVKR
jgi:hypothetical protein